MKSTKEIAYDALREMYDEAEPSLDFDDVLENPNDYPDNWFEQHYLDGERQKEIVEKHCDKYNITDEQHMHITMTAILNLGPASNKEVIEQ